MSTVAGKWSVHRNARHGPFEDAGELVVFTIDASNDDVVAYTSTDGGDTWALENSVSTSAETIDCVQSGSTVHICVQRTDGSFFVMQYSMSLGTFGGFTGTGSNFANVSGTRPVFIARRSNGTYVVFHQGDPEMVMGTHYRRIVYSVWNGVTWSTTTPSIQNGAQAHFDARTALLGTSDRVHMVHSNGATADVNTLSSSGTASVSTISSSAGTWILTGNYLPSLPALNPNDGQVALFQRNNANSPNTVTNAARGTSAQSMSWAIEDVLTGITPRNDTSGPGALVYGPDDVLHAFFVRNDNGNIEYLNDQGTGTWTTSEAFATATTQGISAGLITGGIGVLYNDSGTVTFATYSLGAGGQSIAVGTASETEAAAAITKTSGPVSKAVTTASETETAATVVVSQRVAVTGAAETDAAGAASVASSVTATVTTVTETEAARAVSVETVGAPQSIAVNTASEAETAQTVALSTTVAISVSGVSETETSRPVAVGLGAVSVAVGLAPETESSQAVATVSPHTVSVTGTSETEGVGAIGLTATTSVTVGSAAESEVARTVAVDAGAVPQTVPVGAVAETETARVVTVSFTTLVAVGGVSETEAAQSISVIPGTASVSVGPATEAEDALTATVSLGGVSAPVGGVSEAEAATQASVVSTTNVTVGAVSETEAGRVVDVVVDLTQTVVVGRATETESARLVTATVQGVFRLRLPSLPTLPSLSWRPSRWPRRLPPTSQRGRSAKRFSID